MVSMQPRHPNPYGKPIIFFDGVCAMCNTFVAIVLKADPEERFLFAPLQGDTARELLPALSEDPRECNLPTMSKRPTRRSMRTVERA
jgi:predicted DCC family thiol-disulfide oxidoreductase YuxK